MVRCAYCGRETELYEAGVASCIQCSASRSISTKSAHSRLVEELVVANSELDEAVEAYNRILSDIPSGLPHPDGVQRIHSVSDRLSIAKKNVSQAHSRLSDFLSNGIIPEDLKGLPH